MRPILSLPEVGLMLAGAGGLLLLARAAQRWAPDLWVLINALSQPSR